MCTQISDISIKLANIDMTNTLKSVGFLSVFLKIINKTKFVDLSVFVTLVI